MEQHDRQSQTIWHLEREIEREREIKGAGSHKGVRVKKFEIATSANIRVNVNCYLGREVYIM